MKKILLSALIAIAISTVTYGQIETGTVLLGGNLYLNSSKSESTSSQNHYENKSKGYSFTPSAGVAIKPNTFVGLQLGYSYSKNNSEPSSGIQEISNYSAELFIRRYITLGKGLYLFAQPGAYFNRNINEYNTNNTKQDNRGWSAGVSIYPGLSYAVSKRFHLEAGLGNLANISYGRSENEYKDHTSGNTSTSKGSGFTLSSSLSNNNSIFIGFRFLLPKKIKSS